MHESVDLPPVEVKRLLHPLDLSAARRLFLTSWWLERAASLCVAFALASVLWVISGNPVSPILVPLAMMILGRLIAGIYRARSWDYIPRGRQDRRRRPGSLRGCAAVAIDALALAIGVLVLVTWLADRSLEIPVAAFLVGTGVGIALLQVGGVVAAALPPAAGRATAGARAVMLAAVLVATWFASMVLIGPRWSAELVSTAALGAFSMLLVQAVCHLVGLVPKARTTGVEESR